MQLLCRRLPSSCCLSYREALCSLLSHLRAPPCHDAEAARTKLEVAKEVIKGMLGRLAPDDCGELSAGGMPRPAGVQIACSPCDNTPCRAQPVYLVCGLARGSSSHEGAVRLLCRPNQCLTASPATRSPPTPCRSRHFALLGRRRHP